MESLAGLGINKPAKAWIDSDIDRAIVQLTFLAQQFNRHEAVARVKGRKDKRSAMAMILSVDGRPTPIVGEFDVLDSDFDRVAALTDQIEEILNGRLEKVPNNIVLAALARVGAARIHKTEESETVDG